MLVMRVGARVLEGCGHLGQLSQYGMMVQKRDMIWRCRLLYAHPLRLRYAWGKGLSLWWLNALFKEGKVLIFEKLLFYFILKYQME
jgi:hypothetical protein